MRRVNIYKLTLITINVQMISTKITLQETHDDISTCFGTFQFAFVVRAFAVKRCVALSYQINGTDPCTRHHSHTRPTNSPTKIKQKKEAV